MVACAVIDNGIKSRARCMKTRLIANVSNPNRFNDTNVTKFNYENFLS